MGIIYKATNKINGKYYIGKTIQTLEQRKNKHKSKAKNDLNIYFYNAINKYGFDNFDWEVIDTALTLEELSNKEIYHIERTSAFICDDLGYNMTSGGDGVGYSLIGHPREKEIRKKMSENNSGLNNPMWGKTHTSEELRKMSDSHKGNKNPNWGNIGKLSATFGRKHTPKEHEKMNKYVYIIINKENIYVTNNLKIFSVDNNLNHNSLKNIITNNKKYKKNWYGTKIKKEDFDNINIKEISLKHGIDHKELKSAIEKFKKERNTIS